MSVIGFDFGNENCFIAVARAGGIETIANEYSQRVTPSYVGFGDKQRDLGVSAKNKQNTNIKSTIYGFKRYIGRKVSDPVMENEKSVLPYEIVESRDGEVGVCVKYRKQDKKFCSRQITAMLLTKLKQIAEADLHIKVVDCVISVPFFFNDAERRALLDSAKIAGLNCLKLMNETTAVALSYGFYKHDLSEEKPRIVAFVDLGHSALQVSVVAFTKERLKMLACESDVVGGRDFDRVLVEYFCDDFQARYKLDVRSNKRAMIRLYSECEKLKKQMSSIALELPINIECFMEDKDVSGKMKRDQFESLASGILQRIEDTIQRAIAKCRLEDDRILTLEDVESVEIVGGSSRVPAVKAIIRKIFGKEPSTTLNADEAVSRGCALQCAMLSPNFKVKNFSITDLQPYPIAVRVLPKLDPSEGSEYDIFPQYHQVPYSRIISVFRREPFIVEAFYRQEVPFEDKQIAKFHVKVEPRNPEASPEDKVKVKIRVNLNGVFTVVSATLFEKGDESPEPMEEVKDAPMNEGDSAAVNGASDAAPAPAEPEKKKAPSAKQTECKIESVTIDADLEGQGYVMKYLEEEKDMIVADRTEQERLDAKNAVEEYVYEMRDKLADALQDYASDSDKSELSQHLTSTEDWLYGDGEDLATSEYVKRLESLHALGQPIVERYREFQERPRALEEMGAALQKARKALDSFAAGEEQYAHIAKEDMDRLAQQLDTKQAFFDETIGKLNALPKHLPPPVMIHQIREATETFERVANQILSKPKPQPPPPSPPKEEAKEEPMEEAPKEDVPEEPMETA
ncbi:heat shock 70 kDa protein 4 [Galendromus occidentalis]|uniref:Heat shock 70 kDa protein 4 n=1 Tax=Galendromus occidentalis TaxID=34638 RepID=A0AAJ6QL07_9ACAR|nr:heat shock 70 kDa protein 4 [Galendromus occidentalis]